MPKDINIHVKTPGAAQAKQQVDRIADSTRKMGDTVNNTGKRGAAGMDALGNSTKKTTGFFKKFTSSIGSWVTGLASIALAVRMVTSAIRAQAQAITEHAEIAARQQKKLLALQSMGTFFEDHPDARKEVAAYAKLGRRGFGEVAEAWYGLESKGAGLTEQQKKGIMQEALELGRMEPDADLKSIIDVFSLYAKETRQQDINRIQNVIRMTLSKAGAELSEIGQQLPAFLSLGIAGKLTGAETAGLWAFATTRASSPEKATVGIRNIFTALRGKGTPESLELLQQLGATPDKDIFEQLAILGKAQKAGKFGLPEAELIAGKENIAVLLSMLTEPQAMRQTVGEVTAVDRGDIDITKEKLDLIMGNDEVAFLEEMGRQLEVELENIKGSDTKALRWKTFLQEYEKRMREADVSEVFIKWQLLKYKAVSWVGDDPEDSQWPLDPFGPFPQFPETLSGGNTAPVIINNHNDVNYFPTVEPPRKGPRYDPEGDY